MKPLISKLSEYNSIVFYPFTLIWRKPWVLVGMFIILAATGCFRKFYNAGTTKGISMAEIDSLKAADKYFVVHFQNNLTYNIANLQLNGDTITGDLRHLTPDHTEALKVKEHSTRVLRGKYSWSILREVHIYSNQSADPNSRTVSLSRNSLYRMDIYEFDKGRTTTSTVVSIIGIVVSIALIVLILSSGSSTPTPAPTSGDCNCPKIHIEKDGQFEYVNGVFSGAVYSNLERSDILPLENLQPDSNISIRVSNTPGEKQFINTVSLIAVKHDPHEKVLADRKGEFFILDRFETVGSATDQIGNNISGLLSAPDDSPFSFDKDLDREGPSGAILEFNYPKNSSRATLMIRARNTNWASSLTQTYVSLFGNKFSQWRNHIEKTEPHIMEKRELEQSLPISVYVENGDKWEFVDYFPLTGSTAYRNLVMSIPVPANSKNAKLKIKLETVFNFWHVDQAVLDPETRTPVNVLAFDPSKKNSENLNEQLRMQDRNYLVIDDDQSIDLNFSDQILASQKGTTSYFLKASGYYHYEDLYMGDPDMSRLQDFKKPGAFSRFSKQQYKEYLYWANAVTK